MQPSKNLNRFLWFLQIFFGLFLAVASGLPKLILPIESIPLPVPIAPPLLLFIGVCEVLGGIGLILPGILHIRPGLTPLAAAGLLLITIAATGYNLAANSVGSAIFAGVIGLIMAFIGYCRCRVMPLRGATPAPVLQSA